MPTYEYVCKACNEHLEVVQSFKDDPLTTCTNCGGVLRKVFGNIGIAFKGSGFYKTDSRSASSSAGTKSSSGGGSSSSGGSEGAGSGGGDTGSSSTSASTSSSSSGGSSGTAAAAAAS